VKQQHEGYMGSSSTLVHSNAPEMFPSVFLHPPTSATQPTTRSPSPDMPGLSYSPSSASSDSPSCCSTGSDRSQHLNVFFEDASVQSDYFNSPVAVVNTQLLVPGYAAQQAFKQPLSTGFELGVPPANVGFAARSF